MIDFVPAAAHLASLLTARGENRRAAGVIEKTWQKTPHPELVGTYQTARAADDGIARVRAFQDLAKHNPEHAESHIAIAAAALEARLWGEARSHLATAAGDNAPARFRDNPSDGVAATTHT